MNPAPGQYIESDIPDQVGLILSAFTLATNVVEKYLLSANMNYIRYYGAGITEHPFTLGDIKSQRYIKRLSVTDKDILIIMS